MRGDLKDKGVTTFSPSKDELIRDGGLIED